MNMEKNDKIILEHFQQLESKKIRLNISYDGFVLVNNVLKEYDNMKEETNLWMSTVHQRF